MRRTLRRCACGKGLPLFHRGRQLHIHKAYTGPELVAYVDTGLYEGGQRDWYEAYSEVDF
jgi:hypothetical protein